jgi:hypothetical protein
MDAQIWYAVWSTIFGGIAGAFSRLGEVGVFHKLILLQEFLRGTLLVFHSFIFVRSLLYQTHQI